MDRLDKIISNNTTYSRKDVKKIIQSGNVIVNNVVIKDPNKKFDKDNDEIYVYNKRINIQEHMYIMLNKPQGYVCATEDKKDKTVIDLIPQEYLVKEIFPVGRLDKDTTGLLILTDDGVMAHNLLSPIKHVSKTYIVKIDIPLTQEMCVGFKNGVVLNDGICKEAKLEILEENVGKVTLTEGRYHQIKRMFGCFGAKVIELHRESMGNLSLPKDMKLGECREISEEELILLKNSNRKLNV